MPPKAADAEGAKKKAAPPAHPPYATMVKAAIAALKERTGSSSVAIWKYIETNYKGVSKTHMASQLKKMVEKGKLVKVKASFKLSDSFKKDEVKPKKVAKKPAAIKAKKPAAKKPTTPKKPAVKAKKPATKAKKPAGTKAVTKKATPKKPAAKKPAKTAAKPKAAAKPAKK